MFVDLTYFQLDDGVFDDEDCNQGPVNEVDIVYIGGFMAMDEDSCFDNVDVPKGSSAPMDWALACLHETITEITVECTTTSVSIELCDHVTSFLRGVGSNIHHFCLAQINESMNLGMVFHLVDDGFENSIN